MDPEIKSILSILSHVVHGYVGNRATVFPLQYNGWDVDAVNTTNYSNHPGYGQFEGKPSSAELIGDLIQGLKDIVDFNATYDMILTGYTPSPEILETVYQHLEPIFTNTEKPKPIWIVDPVLGDNGKMYVSEKLIPLYQKVFKSGYVTITTPNQFEFEILVDSKVTSWETLELAIKKFDSLYKVPYVVISSVSIEGKSYSVGFDAQEEKLFAVPIDILDCAFSGCGDLFVGLLANQLHNNHNKLAPQVLAQVLYKLNKILQHSYNAEMELTHKPVKSVKDIRIVSLRQYLLEEAPLNQGIIYL